MDFKFILGVDISKQWFNFSLMDLDLNICNEGEIKNEPDSIFLFIKHLKKELGLNDLSQVLLVMEYTGVYVNHLRNCWLIKGGQLSMVQASKISQHLANQQSWKEKTDAMDAKRIAEYSIRFYDKLKIWQTKPYTLEKLQAFQRQRSRLKRALVLLTVPTKESKEFDSQTISQAIEKNQKQTIKAIKNDLIKIEQQLDLLIEQDDNLRQIFQRITSVPGVGKCIAREVVITTQAFTCFLPNQAKSFAKYCGVIPRPYQSGKISRRQRINKKANKKMKTLLTMGAISLINSKTELGEYYHRKRAEQKAHLSVINAMRNKLVLRIFAVIKNNAIYQKNMNTNLVKP